MSINTSLKLLLVTWALSIVISPWLHEGPADCTHIFVGALYGAYEVIVYAGSPGVPRHMPDLENAIMFVVFFCIFMALVLLTTVWETLSFLIRRFSTLSSSSSISLSEKKSV